MRLILDLAYKRSSPLSLLCVCIFPPSIYLSFCLWSYWWLCATVWRQWVWQSQTVQVQVSDSSLTYTHTSAQDEDTRQLFLCFLSWVSLTHTQVQWRVTQWGGHQPVTCTCVATGHDDTLIFPSHPHSMCVCVCVCVWVSEWCCYHKGRGQKRKMFRTEEKIKVEKLWERERHRCSTPPTSRRCAARRTVKLAGQHRDSSVPSVHTHIRALATRRDCSIWRFLSCGRFLTHSHTAANTQL